MKDYRIEDKIKIAKARVENTRAKMSRRVACAYQPHAHSVHQNQSLLLVRKMHTCKPYSLALIEAISFFAVSQKR